MVCNCSQAGTKACDDCQNNPSKMSRGYCEVKPFETTFGLKQFELTMEQREQDELVRKRITETIFNNLSIISERRNSINPFDIEDIIDITDKIVKIVKKRYGI